MTLKEEIERAWADFGRGALGEAEQRSMALVTARRVSENQVPLAQVWLTKAAMIAQKGDRSGAYELLQKALYAFPENPYAQELSIAMLREAGALRIAGGKAPANGRLVLGMGTGRSGSTSLTLLLQAQPGTYSGHEHPPRIPWDGPYGTLDFHLRRLRLLTSLYPVAADCCHWWLTGFGRVLHSFPKARAVVLRRDRDATVASFLKLKGGGAKGTFNHWIDHDGSHWRHSPWDVTYPSFKAHTMEGAIGQYWDEYYRRAEMLVRQYPENVKLFETAAVGEAGGQAEILQFLGYTDPVLPGPIKANNDGRADEGTLMWPNPMAK
jgi:hypothetical protein